MSSAFEFPRLHNALWPRPAITVWLLAVFVNLLWGQETARKNGMVLIPARNASYTIGSSSGFDNEAPMHTVTFSHSFYMDTTEVTQKQYRQVMSAVYSQYAEPTWNVQHGVGDTYPVYAVEWGDAALYCNARSKLEGLDTAYQYIALSGHPGDGCSLDGVVTRWTSNGYRLATEAEWEFACRAGSASDFYWGKNAVNYPVTAADTAECNAYAVWAGNAWNYHAEHADFGTHQVATKKPNAFGLYDMCGNVFEWINDWYLEYGEAAVTDPTGAEFESYRYVRGGSWGNGSEYLRSANRSFASPDYYIYFCGFRTVLPVITTAVDRHDTVGGQTVTGFQLQQNYPNPFNPTTAICFHLQTRQPVTLAVYDITGRLVATLLNQQALTAGAHTVHFEAKDIPAGVYYYRLRTPEQTAVKKMVLVR